MGICCLELYATHDFETLYDFTKHGICAIEVWGAACHFVGVCDEVIHLYALVHKCCSDFLQGLWTVLAPPYYVELTSAAAELGVYFVGLASCGYHSSAVVQVGVYDLGWQGIAWLAIAEQAVFGGSFAGGITALYHEVTNDSVEECAVVVAFLYKSLEVVAVDGCLV